MHSEHFVPCPQCALEFQKLKEENKALADKAYKDALTGQPNRQLFDEVFDRECASFDRKMRQHTPSSDDGTVENVLCLTVVDIDRFKAVNDTYGHLVGDAILRKLGKILKSPAVGFRMTDFVARWGGEEFAIIMPDTKLEGAKQKVEALRKYVEANLFVMVGGVKVSATVSCGMTTYQPPKLSQSRKDSPRAFRKRVQDCFARADIALYHSKGNGRNCTSVEVKM